MRIVCFILLQCFAMMVLADSTPNTCLQGIWQFDSDKSDNPERLLKKLQRKQKRQEEVLRNGRPMYDSEKEDLSLSNNIPDFVFLTDDINLELSANKVDVLQRHLRRSLLTEGGHSLSLAAMNKSSDSVVAGWENGILVVETSSPNGIHVMEAFSLISIDWLRVMVEVGSPFEKDKTLIEKVYRRKEHSHKNCDSAALKDS